MIAWLDEVMVGAKVGRRGEGERLERIAQEGDSIFQGYKF